MISLSLNFFSSTRRTLGNTTGLNSDKLSEIATEKYIEIIRERIKTQVLGPFNVNFEDLQKTDFNNLLFQNLYQRAGALIDEYNTQGLEAIIASVDINSEALWKISMGTRMNESRIGFSVTGSGSDSAQWTILHKGYDQNNGMTHALVIGLAAKFQAEESLGVGSSTEVKIIRRNGIATLNDDSIDKIRKSIASESDRQKIEMQKIIKEIKQYGVNGNEKK